MHVKSISFRPYDYPTRDRYPFNMPVFHLEQELSFDCPVTFFVGENGAGKSTLLTALARRCGIHIWRDSGRSRLERNPFEDRLGEFISIAWSNGPVPGSFFGSAVFQDFTELLDEWAVDDPGQLQFMGGRSLVTQSHGQAIMSYFRHRYGIKGLYFMDEPETALSPKIQIELLALLAGFSQDGPSQFIIATHSPILLAVPGAVIYNFDGAPIKPVRYEDTEHYKIFKDFMADTQQYLDRRPGFPHGRVGCSSI